MSTLLLALQIPTSVIRAPLGNSTGWKGIQRVLSAHGLSHSLQPVIRPGITNERDHDHSNMVTPAFGGGLLA